jgi:drug/metabolite transporter (DMT)-like permease
MYGIPFAALIWSWLILGIVPSAVALLGGAVIIIGVAMIQHARRERVPKETPIAQEVPA